MASSRNKTVFVSQLGQNEPGQMLCTAIDNIPGAVEDYFVDSFGHEMEERGRVGPVGYGVHCPIVFFLGH